MTVIEFKEYLKERNIPDDAEIVVFADHGQNFELSSGCNFSRSNLQRDMESMIWEYEGYENDYDEDYLEEYPKDGKITAVTIYGW